MIMRLFSRNSIRNILILLVFFAVLPALLIIFYSGLELRRTAIENAEREVSFLAQTMAEVQRGITNSTRQFLATLARMVEIKEMDGRAANIVLRELSDENPAYLNIVAINVDGTVFASGKPFGPTSLADRPHLKRTLADRKFTVGEYIVTRIGKEDPSLPFIYPVLDPEGRPLFILSAVLHLENFAGFFDVAGLPEDSIMAVTDRNGIRIFFHPSRAETNPIGVPILKSAWDKAKSTGGPGTTVHRGSDGVIRIYAFHPVYLDDDGVPYMYMWAGIPEASVLRPANMILARNLLLLLLAACLALAIARLAGNRALLAPIKRLISAADAFAGGDSNARSGIGGGPEELMTLANAFDNMADSLVENQRRLRTIADYTYDWEYWLGPDGRLLWISPSCERVTGYTPSDFLSDRSLFERIVDQADADRFSAHVRMQLEDERVSNLDFRIVHKSGRTVWIDHHCVPIFSSDGSFLGRRVSNRDITDRKQMEVSLQQAQKMEAVGRLAGGVAHDFNNMLNVILGHTELALGKTDRENPTHQDLLEIRKAAGRSADLTRQLLGFARKQTISPKVIDLNDTVESMLNMLRRLIGEDVDLVWMPGKALPPVRMDPSQLDQMLANLCVNARDAMEGAGRISIKTERVILDEDFCAASGGLEPGRYLLLSVSDDGCGMDGEVIENLFEPFYTTKEVGQGTGLGLATVYGIVKQNGGLINVSSEPWQGTTFSIYFPACEDGAEAAPCESLEEAIAKGNETLLLVEDEPMLLEMGESMLESFGYRVLAAGSPAAAFKLAGEHQGRIDLLITDVVMPEMNGRELASELQSLYPGLKCLFMSGYTADAIAHHGALDEGVNFIQKPFTMQNLAAVIRGVLEDSTA